MLRVLNMVLVFSVVILAVWMYELKYGVRASVKEVAQLKRDIAQTEQEIILLRAEWSHMMRPKRLQELAGRHLKLERVGPAQIIREQDISKAIPERDPYQPLHEGNDPIAGLLRIDQ